MIFQSSAFKASVEKEIAVENKKNSELVKREKQLKSQIDNLISDSLALLKRRLDELGIQVITHEVVYGNLKVREKLERHGEVMKCLTFCTG